MECGQEMGGIIPVGVMHHKIINNQSEVDVMGVMLPDAGGKGTWVVAMGEQELLELVIGNLSSFWQSIHATPDFMAIVDKHMQVVMVRDVRGKRTTTGMCMYA